MSQEGQEGAHKASDRLKSKFKDQYCIYNDINEPNTKKQHEIIEYALDDLIALEESTIGALIEIEVIAQQVVPGIIEMTKS